MKKRTGIFLMVALAASICFNILFIGGYLRTRMIMKKIETVRGRIELISDRLDFSEDQEREVTELVLDLREQQAALKNSHLDGIDRFWTEIVKDKPDFDTIREELDGTRKAGRESRKLAIKYLWKILQVLSPEQREGVVKIIRKKKTFDL